jgi:hypothetical protein
VCPGDFVITGVRGEHYPCKPDVFAATYEPVPDSEWADRLAEGTVSAGEIEIEELSVRATAPCRHEAWEADEDSVQCCVFCGVTEERSRS